MQSFKLSDQNTVQNTKEEDLLFKSREFGKDITNAFIGLRSSLDHGIINKHQINTKQAKLADFKNFVCDKSQIHKPSQTSNLSFAGHRFTQSTNFSMNQKLQPAQSNKNGVLNLKRNVKKQSTTISNAVQAQNFKTIKSLNLDWMV